MVQLVTLLTFTSVFALSSAQEGKKHGIGFTKVPANENPQVKPRSLEQRQTCSGTCSECFGSGYTLCPGSSLFCYKPGDPSYGLDSCPGSSTGSDSSDTYSSSSYVPTSTGSAGDSDFCSGTAATCVTCFGAGYLDCGDGINCYNPDGRFCASHNWKHQLTLSRPVVRYLPRRINFLIRFQFRLKRNDYKLVREPVWRWRCPLW